MKTAYLTGFALEWAVAIADGWNSVSITDNLGTHSRLEKNGQYRDPKLYRRSSSWTQGGPIIEREKIELAFRPRGDMRHLHGSRKPDWAAGIYSEITYTTEYICSGSTPLEAAMRCYVLSKLGEDIEIPKDLSWW